MSRGVYTPSPGFRSPSPAFSQASAQQDDSSADEMPSAQPTVTQSGSPGLASAEQEEVVGTDTMTCLWDDCGIVFSHLPSLIEHIHSSALMPTSVKLIQYHVYSARRRAQVKLHLRLGDMQSPRPRTDIPVRAHLPHPLTYRREAVYMFSAR